MRPLDKGVDYLGSKSDPKSRHCVETQLSVALSVAPMLFRCLSVSFGIRASGGRSSGRRAVYAENKGFQRKAEKALEAPHKPFVGGSIPPAATSLP